MKKVIIACLMVVALFSIAYAAGTATVTWTAPTQYVDGTALPASDIAVFTVYHGTAPGNYTEKVTVLGTAAKTYAYSSLPTGTHYFTVTATTIAAKGGLESAYAPEASKVISAVAPGTCSVTVQ